MKFLPGIIALVLFSLKVTAQVASVGWIFNAPAIPPNLRDHTLLLGDQNYIPAYHRSTDATNSPDQSTEREDGIRGYNSVVIGTSYFDLQTNASICKTFFRDENSGDLYAVWNFAPVIDPDFLTRGTGFNYFNGNSWQAFPTSRIESSITGWPNVTLTATGKTLVMVHNQSFGQLELLSNDDNGSGSWMEQQDVLPSPSLYGNWWPRMIRGGVNNDYVHAISITLPVSHGGALYKGQDGALLYSRSTDNGATWTTSNKSLQYIDSSEFYRIRPDNYAIDAYQNIVAIVVGGFANDLVLLQSTDNGNNWQKKIVQKFPIDHFKDEITDIDGDGIPDAVDSNDGSLSVFIDNTGRVHVWSGYVRVINTDSTDGKLAFYPTTNGIWYWNTDMAGEPMKLITGAQDLNQNGTLDISGYGTFNAGLATHPSSGADNSGTIWFSYSAVVENAEDAAGKNVRHTYLMGSQDAGLNWSAPYDVVNEVTAEGIYGAIARTSDNLVRLIYQKDNCAGISTTYGNPDPCNSGGLNEILYVEVPAGEVLSVNNTSQLAGKSAVYPNPSSGIFHVSLQYPLAQKETISIYDESGELLKECDPAINSGDYILDLSELPPGFYFMKAESAGFMICKKVCIAK